MFEKFSLIRRKLTYFYQQLNSTIKFKLVLGLSITVITILAVVITFSIIRSRSAKPSITSTPIVVKASPVKKQIIPITVDSLGSLTAVQQIDVSAEINGQIAKIAFKDGQHVKAGQLLFQLDDAIAYAQLMQAQARLKLSQRDFQRQRKLLAMNALPQQAFDKAREAFAEDQAKVNEEKVSLQKMRLVAPFTGTVSSSAFSVGQYVSAGKPLVTLVDTDHLKVSYHIPEIYLSQLKLGQAVAITSDAFPGKAFLGKVNYISPLIDDVTRTVEVHAEIPNTAQRLVPGMFVSVKQKLGERQHALVIPVQALLTYIGGDEVYVVKQNRAVETPVKVGIRFGDQVEIIQGLAAADTVVIAGQQNLSDGKPVQVINASSTNGATKAVR